MAITDEKAIKFSNEQVRPMAEMLRNLYYTSKAMNADWFNGVNVLIPYDNTEILQDGREINGDNLLSGQDIGGIMTQVGQFITQMEQAGVLGVVQKPCVRAFRSE